MQLAGGFKQAFHVVAPSLPGFAFSSAAKQKGFGLKQIAKTLNQLMLELGYTKYVAQGLQLPSTTQLLLFQGFDHSAGHNASMLAVVFDASVQAAKVIGGMLHCADLWLRCADVCNFMPMSDVLQCQQDQQATREHLSLIM